MSGHYNTTLVFVSFAISILASWVALDLSSRVALQLTQLLRAFWLVLGSISMGIGIWSMHYVGMLAYQMAMPVLYDWPTVILSMFAAIAASAIALFLVNLEVLSWTMTISGASFMGVGIASMHYIGMAAMRMPAQLKYDQRIVAASLLVAILISAIALRLTFSSKGERTTWSIKKAQSALLMGLAIPLMHYLGMKASSWTVGDGNYSAFDLRHAIKISSVSTAGIVLISILMLGIALISAGVDRHLFQFRTDLRTKVDENVVLVRHSDRLQSAFRAGGVGIWECDPATNLFYVDEPLRDLYDVEHDDLPIPRPVWRSRVHPDDQEALDEHWIECLNNRDKYENEYRIVRKDGEIRRCRSIASVVRSELGQVIRILGMTWDVTEERQNERDSAEQAKLFRLTLEAIGDAVISTDDLQKVAFINPAASQLTGWAAKDAIGRMLAEVFITLDEVSGLRRSNPIQRCVESGSSLSAEDAVLLSANGDRHNIKKHIALLGKGSAAVLTFQDITGPRRMEKELLYSATHDSLTGLYNRGAFERALTSLWEGNCSGPGVHCLCILDLDRFKIINDTSGHIAGDGLLREVARMLLEGVRPNDLVARMGGDEFMLLLIATSAEQGQACVDRLLATISSFRFPWNGKTYDVTASVGLVGVDGQSPDPDVLISQADVAVFAAKRSGRNQLSVYHHDIGETARHHQEMQVVADLRRAIEENCFELHAQPIVSIRAHEAASRFEILVRMRDQHGNLISPALFIPAAERYGLMSLIDRWVIRNTFELLASFQQRPVDLHLSINVSAESLSDSALWSFVKEQFLITGVSPSEITFEVTETGLINNVAQASTFLSRVRAAGAKVALDDFGTGLSSLSYLKQFPLDAIKIDGSFIKKLASSPLDQTIVKSIADIARSMHASTVAECVEEVETIELLRHLGVDYVQGWATGKPTPLTEVLSSVSKDTTGGTHLRDRMFLVGTDAA
jgi:diguanylate cyclase (GGDEF)-like protein/PAS domain S-box-containing protein